MRVNGGGVYVHSFFSFPWGTCRPPCEERQASLRNYSVTFAHSTNEHPPFREYFSGFWKMFLNLQAPARAHGQYPAVRQ